MQGHYEKIHFPTTKPWSVEGRKVVAFGFSGGIGIIQKIKALLEAGITAETVIDNKDTSFNILMVTENREVYNWTVGLTAQNEQVNDLFVTSGNFSIGSGGIYGLAVMAIKGSAIDGVRAAMKVDVHSGGYIDVWSFDDPTKLHRVDPNPILEADAQKHIENGGAILCAPGG